MLLCPASGFPKCFFIFMSFLNDLSRTTENMKLGSKGVAHLSRSTATLSFRSRKTKIKRERLAYRTEARPAGKQNPCWIGRLDSMTDTEFSYPGMRTIRSRRQWSLPQNRPASHTRPFHQHNTNSAPDWERPGLWRQFCNDKEWTRAFPKDAAPLTFTFKCFKTLS